MSENLCRFIPQRREDSLHIINVVLETAVQVQNKPSLPATYQIHLVTRGEGILHTPRGQQEIRTGDVFFCLPGVMRRVEPKGELEYLYMSYLGIRANALADKLDIREGHCVFPDNGDLTPLWRRALTVPAEQCELCSEGVLLYTMSVLTEKTCAPEERRGSDAEQTALLIKKYIDDHYADPELSLAALEQALSYNGKYISSLFKRYMKIGVMDYLKTVRVGHACSLMEQGLTGVRDIAGLCGYADPLYFSKVFRTRLGVSPRQYISRLSEGRKTEG